MSQFVMFYCVGAVVLADIQVIFAVLYIANVIHIRTRDRNVESLNYHILCETAINVNILNNIESQLFKAWLRIKRGSKGRYRVSVNDLHLFIDDYQFHGFNEFNDSNTFINN